MNVLAKSLPGLAVLAAIGLSTGYLINLFVSLLATLGLPWYGWFGLVLFLTPVAVICMPLVRQKVKTTPSHHCPAASVFDYRSELRVTDKTRRGPSPVRQGLIVAEELREVA